MLHWWSASPWKCWAAHLRESSSRHQPCPLWQSTQFRPQKPASLVAPVSLQVAEGEQRRDNSHLVWTESCLRGNHSLTATQIQGSWKQISPYLSKQSKMVTINTTLSFVNLSALLSLYSQPHFHSSCTSPIPPCHFGSALEKCLLAILGTAKSCLLVFYKIGFPIWAQ